MVRVQQTKGRPPDVSDGLPVNIDTERFVLGCILLDAEAYLPSVKAALAPIDFSLEKHRIIYRRALDVDHRGQKVDRVTVAEELTRHNELVSVGGLSYLVTLDDGLPQIPRIDSYVEIIKDKSVRRRIIDGADAITKRALIQTEDTRSVIAAAAEFFRGLGESDQKTETVPSTPTYPDSLHEDAYYGIAGGLVRAIEPHTEADPAALLVQTVVGFGSLAGRGPYYLAEADRHHTNEYAVIVGATAKGRKGTSWGRILAVLERIDEHWVKNCQLAGLGSGEALIDAAGAEDRRTMVVESELARLLAVVSREGSTISASFRNGWDTGTLSIRTRQNKVKVDGAHLSLIGHITREELLRRLDSTEMANGFGNRILWGCARRSKSLPHGGGDMTVPSGLLDQLQKATLFARKLGNTRVKFDRRASLLWEQVYADLSEGRPGMLGSMTSRAEAHVVRLALIYALLDCKDEIQVEHLLAALAVWRYCEASARFIWGTALGDPEADEILRALRAAGSEGLTRWDVMNHFSRHKKADQLDRAISVLAERGPDSVGI
jgi:hypothetical protein